MFAVVCIVLIILPSNNTNLMLSLCKLNERSPMHRERSGSKPLHSESQTICGFSVFVWVGQSSLFIPHTHYFLSAFISFLAMLVTVSSQLLNKAAWLYSFPSDLRKARNLCKQIYHCPLCAFPHFQGGERCACRYLHACPVDTSLA